MQTRVKALEEEKQTLKEEGDARVQDKEQQIVNLGDEIQQKAETIERQNLAHQSEIMQMQQQVKDANMQAELQKDLMEAKVEEVKSLSSQVETLSEEKKTFEQMLSTQQQENEERIITLRRDNFYLQSKLSKLSQRITSLEVENSSLKLNVSVSNDTLKVKTLESEAITKGLKEKDVIITEKSEQLTIAMEYVMNKKQVNKLN